MKGTSLIEAGVGPHGIEVPRLSTEIGIGLVRSPVNHGLLEPSA
jgi:hypothetical protein